MDIDIDFPSNFDPQTFFPQAIQASMVKNDVLTKHPCGHYFQAVPVDSVTGLAAIPYEEAEVLGYTKIDFLHLSILDKVGSKQELRDMMKVQPDWKLLEDPSVVNELFQLRNHYDMLCKIKPKTIEELADCIALIRPSKRHLIPKYINTATRHEARHELYVQPHNNQQWFKKAHAVAYAFTIILQLHLIQREQE